MDTLLLRSSDSFLLMISFAAAKLSVTLRMTIENRYPDMDLIIPVTGVDGETLDKVIEWMEHHKFDMESTLWDRKFFAAGHDLWEMMAAAHFLEIDELLEALQRHCGYGTKRCLGWHKSPRRSGKDRWAGSCYEDFEPGKVLPFAEFKSRCVSRMADHLEEAKNLYDEENDKAADESDPSESADMPLKVPEALPTPIPPWHFEPGYKVNGRETVWSKVPLKMVNAEDIEEFNENGWHVDDQSDDSYAADDESEISDIPCRGRRRRQYSNNVSSMFMLSLPADMMQSTPVEGSPKDSPEYAVPVFANGGHDGYRGRIIPFNGGSMSDSQLKKVNLSEEYDDDECMDDMFLEPLKCGRNGIYDVEAVESDDIDICNLFND